MSFCKASGLSSQQLFVFQTDFFIFVDLDQFSILKDKGQRAKPQALRQKLQLADLLCADWFTILCHGGSLLSCAAVIGYKKAGNCFRTIPGLNRMTMNSTSPWGYTLAPYHSSSPGVQHSSTTKIAPQQHFKNFDHAIFPPFFQTNLSCRLVPMRLLYHLAANCQ